MAPSSVLPLARGQWLFQLFGSSVAVTAAVLLTGAAIAGLASALYAILGLVGVLMFGTVFVGSVRALATDGLVLRADGFSHAGRWYPRPDIAEFVPVGIFAKSHVRIVFAPGAGLSAEQKLAQACAKVGFYHPASHIPVKGYDTGEVPLQRVLTEWLVVN